MNSPLTLGKEGMADRRSPLDHSSHEESEAPSGMGRERVSIGYHTQVSTRPGGVPGCALRCQEPRCSAGESGEGQEGRRTGGDGGGPLRRRTARSRGFGGGLLACLLVGAGLASVSGQKVKNTLEGKDTFSLDATPLDWRMWSTMPNTGDPYQACARPCTRTLPVHENVKLIGRFRGLSPDVTALRRGM